MVFIVVFRRNFELDSIIGNSMQARSSVSRSRERNVHLREETRHTRARAHIHARREAACSSFYPAGPRRALSAITARLLLFRQVKSVGCRYGVMTVLEVVSRLSAEKSRS
jgi:hypothetical protein